MSERARDMQSSIGSAGLWLLAGAVVGLGFQVNKIADELERANSLYLCVELWKLGGKDAACDVMLAARKDRGNG